MMVTNDRVETTDDRKMERIVLLLLLLGLVLRLVGLGQHSYWFDEAREVLRALTPWPDVLFVNEGVDPPLYRLLVFPIASVTTAEFWLRLPSVLFSVATIYLAYYWLRLAGRPKLGVITAVLLTVAPVQIYYAQEASQYSLVVFLAVLLLIAFERAARNGRWRDWFYLTLVSLAAMYTYYGLAWLFPILELDLVWRTWQQRTKERIVGYVGTHLSLAAGLAALYVWLLSGHIQRFTTRKHLVPRFIQPGLRVIIKTLDNELLNGFVHFFAIPNSPTAPQWMSLFIAALIILGGVILLARQGDAGKRIVIYLLGTAAAMYVGNGLGLYPFGGRYALAALPLFFMVLAAVIWQLWHWQPLAGGVLAGVIVMLFAAFWPNPRLIPNPWLTLPREELRPVVAYVNEHAQPGDFIYVYYGAVPAYQIYQREPVYSTEFGPWFRDWETDEKIDAIQQSVAGRQRFWLALSHYSLDEYNELVDGLAGSAPSYRVVDVNMMHQNAAAALLQRDE